MSEILNQNECCPPFNTDKWHDKYFEWNNKKFATADVFTIFYAPMNFGSVITKLIQKVEKNDASVLDFICLSDHTSKWNMKILLEVDRDIPKAEMKTLSGKFYSKVYEGHFKNTRSWCDDFENGLKKSGHKIKKMYMWYTTCPKCAKKYGKNYVAILGEIE